MGQQYGYSTSYLVLILALSSHQILAYGLHEAHDHKSSDLITKTCGRTLYKDLCISALESVPESKTADLLGLAKIALNIVSINGSKIFDQISVLLNTTSDEFTQQCLTDCSENYEDAIDQIEDSLMALDSRSYNDVNTWVTAAMTDAESCGDAFKEKSDGKSPLTDMNTMFSQLCSICLTITNLLAKN